MNEQTSGRSCPPIYVVSLRADEHRRMALADRLGSSAERLIFVPAVDLRQGAPTLTLDGPTSLSQAGMTGAEMGCALSHIAVMKIFLQQTHPCCIVLEDDVVGTAVDIENASRIAARLPAGAIAILGGQQGLKNRRFLFGRQSEIPGVWSVPQVCRRFIARTCCYALTRSVAEMILERQIRDMTRADNWYRLLAGSISIYFANIFAHPVDRTQSHIERARSTLRGGFAKRLFSDGIGWTIRTNLAKLYVSTILRLMGYRRAETDNPSSDTG
jgi:glycosyl transferase family 25